MAGKSIAKMAGMAKMARKSMAKWRFVRHFRHLKDREKIKWRMTMSMVLHGTALWGPGTPLIFKGPLLI